MTQKLSKWRWNDTEMTLERYRILVAVHFWRLTLTWHWTDIKMTPKWHVSLRSGSISLMKREKNEKEETFAAIKCSRSEISVFPLDNDVTSRMKKPAILFVPTCRGNVDSGLPVRSGAAAAAAAAAEDLIHQVESWLVRLHIRPPICQTAVNRLLFIWFLCCRWRLRAIDGAAGSSYRPTSKQTTQGKRKISSNPPQIGFVTRQWIVCHLNFKSFQD